MAGSPFRGNQHVELDSFVATAIAQEVPTQPGRIYELRFAFSPRPGRSAADNILRVRWNSVQVTVLSAEGRGLVDTVWTDYTFPVKGGPGTTTTLTFEDLGASNTYGTYVDAVSVLDHAPDLVQTSVSNPPEPGAERTIHYADTARNIGTGLRACLRPGTTCLWTK